MKCSTAVLNYPSRNDKVYLSLLYLSVELDIKRKCFEMLYKEQKEISLMETVNYANVLSKNGGTE